MLPQRGVNSGGRIKDKLTHHVAFNNLARDMWVRNLF